jgi:CheY-like chemotaxis protein
MWNFAVQGRLLRLGGEPMQPSHARDAALPRTVLLIESDFLARLDAADDLRTAGFRVLEASNGGEAFLFLAGYPDIAIVVADLRSPGSANGAAIIQWLAQKRPHLPVVLGTQDLIDRVRALLPQGAV